MHSKAIHTPESCGSLLKKSGCFSGKPRKWTRALGFKDEEESLHCTMHTPPLN